MKDDAPAERNSHVTAPEAYCARLMEEDFMGLMMVEELWKCSSSVRSPDNK